MTEELQKTIIAMKRQCLLAIEQAEHDPQLLTRLRDIQFRLGVLDDCKPGIVEAIPVVARHV